MKRSLILGGVAIALFAAACSAANPPTSDLGSGSTQSSSSSGTPGVVIGGDDDDAGSDAAAEASPADAGADADAEAGLPPPPTSICNPTLSLGASAAVPGGAGTFRFAAISKDEKTIAFLDNGTLKVADRGSVGDDFGAPQTVSTDIAPDGVAMSTNGLTILAIGSDRVSFLPFERDAQGGAFTAGDASFYTNLIDDLAPGETMGDPTFIHDDDAILYSIYGRTDDTVHYATRISAFANFDPNGALGWPELRGEQVNGVGHYRHVTGVQDDLQTLFYWDDVSATEKLAHTDGTAHVIATIDLGPTHPYAQAGGTCDRVYFGTSALFFAPTK